MTQQPPLGQGLLIVKDSRPQTNHSREDSPTRPKSPNCQGFTTTDKPKSGGLLWTSDKPNAETSTWQLTTLRGDRHPCLRRHSNPPVPPGELPQTHALDRAPTGIGCRNTYNIKTRC